MMLGMVIAAESFTLGFVAGLLTAVALMLAVQVAREH
jgi:hypothetical protein